VAIGITGGMFLKKQKKLVSELDAPKVYHHSVDMITPSKKTLRQTRHFLAQLLASKSAFIASKFSANIKKIYVKENDKVKKGKLLISLDDSEIRANIASLVKQKNSIKVDIANVKRSLARSKKLLDIEAISQEKYDNINVMYQNKLSNLEAVKEKIKQSKAQLAYLNIKAPFSGRVGSVFLDAGNLALPGKAIISLNSDDQKLVFSYVDTNKHILEGQSVLVDNQEVGKIFRRYDDAKNALLVAEVKLSKSLPYVNKAFVNIDVVISKQHGCSVPQNALLHRKDKTMVMAYKDSHFEAKEVQIILEDKDDVLLKECPLYNIAVASEAKLSLLPSLGEVNVTKEK
jgi:multidrug efflux pump subunit AcrA (membrane-fusion protein)